METQGEGSGTQELQTGLLSEFYKPTSRLRLHLLYRTLEGVVQPAADKRTLLDVGALLEILEVVLDALFVTLGYGHKGDMVDAQTSQTRPHFRLDRTLIRRVGEAAIGVMNNHDLLRGQYVLAGNERS